MVWLYLNLFTTQEKLCIFFVEIVDGNSKMCDSHIPVVPLNWNDLDYLGRIKRPERILFHVWVWTYTRYSATVEDASFTVSVNMAQI